MKISEDIQFCNIKCIFLFKADTPNDFEEAFSQFCSDVKECELRFSDIALNFKCYLKSIGDIERIGRFHYLTEFKWIGYKYGDAITETMNRMTSKIINVTGNLNAPAVIEITPSENLTDLVITGVCEDFITINNLTAGKKIIIDGEFGTVLENGENKFEDTIMWEYPRLVPGINTITLSETNCDISIIFKPRYEREG